MGDARLVELGDELLKIINDIDNGFYAEEQVGAMLDRATAIEDEIIITPATTMEGMAIKLRSASLVSRYCPFTVTLIGDGLYPLHGLCI